MDIQYFVFAAWLNHVDAKGINSLSSLVTANGRSFIRHYLLDFGSALGSAAVGPREGWEGYQTLVEQPGQIGSRVLSFGFKVPKWRTQDYFESPSIGRLPRDHSEWDPQSWWPHITNAASEAFLAKAIAQRRLRILQAFLPKVNPLVDVAISDGRLTFRNIADKATLVATTEETQSPLPTPQMPASSAYPDSRICRCLLRGRNRRSR